MRLTLNGLRFAPFRGAACGSGGHHNRLLRSVLGPGHEDAIGSFRVYITNLRNSSKPIQVSRV